MGNSISYDGPDGKDLSTLRKKGKLSANDLCILKDGLKQVAIDEGGIAREDFLFVAVDDLKIDEEEYLYDFYSIFDDAGDEWVDFKEFAVYSALTARDRRSKKIEYCYRVFDKDGSGTLDREEIREMCVAAARVLKRVNFVLPGLEFKAKKVEPGMFTLDKKEVKKAEKLADEAFDAMLEKQRRKPNGADGPDAVSYREFNRGANTGELKEVLDYFTNISDNLPEIDRDGGDDKKSKKDKKKDKKNKKDDSDDEDEDASSKKSKKDKKKGKKAAKKGESDEASADDASVDEDEDASSKKKDKKKDKKKGKKAAKDDGDDEDAGDDDESGKKSKKKDKKKDKKAAKDDGDDEDAGDDDESGKKSKKKDKKKDKKAAKDDGDDEDAGDDESGKKSKKKDKKKKKSSD